MNKVLEFIRLMRPKQWFKSFFIIVGSIPAIFLMPARFEIILFYLAVGIVNMILLQGVIYTINDIFDLKQDRLHPKKKFRPIAGGVISVKESFVFAIVLFILALTMAYFINFMLVLIDLALFINNLFYSMKPFRLKDIPYLDVGSAALNFPLRVMVGWFLFEPYNQAKLSFSYDLISKSMPSDSIQSLYFKSPLRIIDLTIKFSTVTLSFGSVMLGTFFTAFFLLSLKRLAEKITLKKSGKIRKTLQHYTETKLKLMAILSALIIFISFGLLAWSLKPLLVILSPLILYLCYLYFRLTYKRPKIVAEPELVFTKAPKFITVSLITFILFIIILLV